jgi:serine phosphatase RsbU (regulator of sigma subunit)
MRSGAALLEPARMIVPMKVAGRMIGTITLECVERVYDAQDVAVAEDFALRAGAAVENARLYRAASQIAQALQTSLLPPHLPDVPGAELAAAYHPAWQGVEVGGDFYDVFSTAPGQWYLVIGDVSGKGAEAAAVTALARYTLRTAAARRRSPAAILRWVGEAMLHQDAAGGRFCTIACALVDLARSPAVVTVCCGGHPLPVLRRGPGSVEMLGAPGTLLGLDAEPELRERSTELRPGDTLVLYTDGLTEARAPFEMWGHAELMAAVRAAPLNGPAGLVESLVASALGGRAAPRDDLALLALKFQG